MNSKLQSGDEGQIVSVNKMDSPVKDIYGRPLCIPKRQSPGTAGLQIKVEVNYFALNLEEFFKKSVYHVVLNFFPSKPTAVYRAALEEFNKLYYNNINYAFDGRNSMYTANPVSNKTGYVTIYNNECGTIMTFWISTTVTVIPMSLLKEYFSSGSLGNVPRDALQALHIIMKNQPISMGYFNSGTTLFPKIPKIIDVSGELILREGIFQRLHKGWRPYLNVDVVRRFSLKHIPLLMYIKHELQCDINTKLSLDTMRALSFMVGGLKIFSIVSYRSGTPRYYNVNGLFDSASQLTVEWNNKSNVYRSIVSSKYLTVAEYFKLAYNYIIAYPHLPCLHVSNDDDKWCVPIELCYVLNDKMVPKSVSQLRLGDMQLDPLLAEISVPSNRYEAIANHMEITNYNDNPLLRDLCITVDKHFTSLNARVLFQPTILYAGNKETYPKSGVWYADKCVKGATLSQWIVLNLDENTKIGFIKSFEQKLMYYSKSMNINVGKFSCVYDLFINNDIPENIIKQRLSDFFICQSKKVKELQLVFVILPEQPTSNVYGIVKQISELETGILTQCIKPESITKTMHSKKTITNILLKINTKLNGINHIVATENGMENAMILGAVNSGPTSKSLNEPSIAAVTTSHNLTGSQYNMEWCLQPPNARTISSLDNIIYKQLLKFKNETNILPKKLIYLRKFTNHEDMKELLQTELIEIQQACKKTNMYYKPAITFLVVQKQKHTRIYHSNVINLDNDNEPNITLVGTVIDTEITHPTENSFYLCSKYNQGSSCKPTKYHVIWDDSNFTGDQLQRLVLNTCYMFAPCTSSTICPAPMYYAQLVVNRIRGYLKDKTIDLSRLREEQEKIKNNQLLSLSNPMFFI